ncbi:MAG: undecaprenyl-diphosphate phosphatase [Planctomycetes bacterium]|nr:undecaprenyl-diphosphate phosphatase [Planctomycetota bacterium]MCB9917672.1 undecaprenyl-diphosphate phosphatase [Planctomycetota bacterium]
MSNLVEAALLALVQGLTEFLPISSSAHLILVGMITGRGEGADAAVFDVAVHVGSLLAVVLYFRRELVQLSRSFFASVFARERSASARLAWAVILGTIPAALCGYLLKDTIEGSLRGARVIAWASIGFGILLWVSDRVGRRIRSVERIGTFDALFVGACQALALIPGTSRSGATITAGLFGGLTREAAARFSFLLSIPLILAAGALKTKDLLEARAQIDVPVLAIGVLVSAVSAYLCIEFFLRLVERIGMTPFVVYRILLGIAILVFVS